MGAQLLPYNKCETLLRYVFLDKTEYSCNEVGVLQRIGLQMGNFDDLVYSLNNQNYLLKKGPKIYQLQTASCL